MENGSHYIDEYTVIFAEATELSDKARISEKAAEHYVQIKPALSFQYGEQFLSFATLMEDDPKIAKAYTLMGRAKHYKGKFEEALELHNKALPIREKLRNPVEIANSYINIGYNYERLGLYTSAMNALLKAQKLLENTGERRSQAGVYNNMAMIFANTKKETDAIEYYNTAISIWNEINEELYSGSGLVNLSIVYLNMKDYEKAKNTCLRGREILQQINHVPGMADADNILGLIDYQNKNFNDALARYANSLSAWEEVGNQMGIAGVLCNIGLVHFASGKYEKAYPYLLKAENMDRQAGLKEFLSKVLNGLYECKKAEHKYDEALAYYEEFHKVTTEISGENIQKQLTQLAFEHNVAQKIKEAEIAELKIKELEKDKIWAELSAIYIGLNDHFLKNAFLALSLQIDNDDRSAIKLTDQLKEYYLYLLIRLKNKKATLHEEILSIEKYIDLYKLMRPGKIEFTLDIDSTLNTGKINFPSFILQPLVENAIKHGINKNYYATGRIDLIIYREEDRAIIKVTDDGPGITASKKSSKPENGNTGLGVGYISEAIKRFNMHNESSEIIFNPEQDIYDKINGGKIEGCCSQMVVLLKDNADPS